MSQPDMLFAVFLRQQLDQTGAMEMVIRRAIFAGDCVAEGLPREFASILPAPVHDRRGPHGHPLHRLAQAKPVQEPRCVWADLDAGSHFTDCRGLLEYGDIQAGSAHRDGRRDSADSASDDERVQATHWLSPQPAAIPSTWSAFSAVGPRQAI